MSITANIHYKSYNILNYKLVPPSIFVVLGAAKLVRARNDDHKRKLESCLLGMEMKRQAKSRAGESSRRLRRTATALERGSQRGQIIKKKTKKLFVIQITAFRHLSRRPKVFVMRIRLMTCCFSIWSIEIRSLLQRKLLAEHQTCTESGLAPTRARSPVADCHFSMSVSPPDPRTSVGDDHRKLYRRVSSSLQ
jgi:hypothetical protein